MSAVWGPAVVALLVMAAVTLVFVVGAVADRQQGRRRRCEVDGLEALGRAVDHARDEACLACWLAVGHAQDEGWP